MEAPPSPASVPAVPQPRVAPVPPVAKPDPAPAPQAKPVAAPAAATAISNSTPNSTSNSEGFDRIRPRPAAPGWIGSSNADRAVRIDELGLTRILPVDSATGRSWGYDAPGMLGASGWLEKTVGRGEDAEPTLRLNSNGAAILGVYDGTGGAGAATARRLRDGTELSDAYVASRLVRDLMETWVSRQIDKQRGVGKPDGLAAWLARALQDEAVTVAGRDKGIQGSLRRKLPTTAATMAVIPSKDGVWAETIWAGDSRAFALTPSNGLQVLTVDDTRVTDALALIRDDQPMLNVISADKPFKLNYRTVQRSGPVVFITATDGCFGHVFTPAHFEFLLLDKLLLADGPQQWAGSVIDEMGRFVGDDASFSLMATGFEDFSHLKDAYRRRHDFLRKEHWLPFLAMTDATERAQFREASWAAYRTSYEALIARAVTPR